MIDNIYDKSNYPAFGTGMLSGLVAMIIWVFPFLNAWTGLAGALFTLSLTAGSTFVVLIVTGLYKKHEVKILKCVESRILFLNKKRDKDAKKTNKKNAA